MNGRAIRVFAPATVANVGCGFDILGFAVSAPGDEVVIELTEQEGVRLTGIYGDGGRLPLEPEKNTATVAVKRFLEFLDVKVGMELKLIKKMPLGSGLGSSAASAAAAVFGANALLGNPLTTAALVPFAMESEMVACGARHADNVAPALMGNFVLIRSYKPLELVPIETPKKLCCSLVHPQLEIRTEDARKLLSPQIPLEKAVVQWGNVAGLIAGLLTSDYGLIGRSLEDVIVEPERSILIPGFYRAKAAARLAGALGCSISGSGPSIFALSTSLVQAEAIAVAMSKVFSGLSISNRTYVSKINKNGPQIIN